MCSRVVQAQAPRAIIVPANGKVSSLKLREGDMLWDDLLAQANHLSRSVVTKISKVRITLALFCGI